MVVPFEFVTTNSPAAKFSDHRTRHAYDEIAHAGTTWCVLIEYE